MPEPLRRADRLPDPRGVLHPPQRDRDAALPAAALGPRLRPRPRHDPARLVHDEAQRDDRDGAGLAARASPTCTPSRRPRTPRATAAWSTELEDWLASVTGYDRVSIQPNAGSQGELAGLLAIRGYHRARGEEQRDVCLIPSSAHGTNAASAVMAGHEGGRGQGRRRRYRSTSTTCARSARRTRDDLAAIMVTYPSTHGAYEDGITTLCEIVHEHGGQVYIDGANLNALLGHARPGEFGGDVSHLNLHKTFCIPHGGGGPGVGPVAVREHLAPYLPSHDRPPRAGQARGHRPDQRGAVRLGRRAADLVGLRPADGGGGPRRPPPRWRC